MKTRTTLLAAILGLTVLVSIPVSAEMDTTSCGELQPEWVAAWVDGDTEIKFPTGGTMAEHSAVVGEWLADHLRAGMSMGRTASTGHSKRLTA